ncbi:MAG: HAMP domain-containing sensor histidine kinase [Gammaproteobacteria bacterium]|jgi:two-component system sensor histidine kinase CpxA|nr:HAMP domain-containing sensor histidine kinase [Gammaproteobacteria bacterium]MDP7270470.1 HAMP domain-containing sensor histidine kinase [Gammaproteobacteria bacterium]MDP7419539.1 HAMP domain-containing sensor histidine kinase [Gammaproteobacteria bacterium]HJP05012.1 HAMP domain-containing sensor histidine kinase [Gammaproteobacteria bacterium]
MQWPRSPLYLRMALHIGAALTAFIALGAAALASIAAFELRGYIETRQSSLGKEAARVLADGGRPALENWLQTDADIPNDVSIYILNQNSEDILGRKLPVVYENFVRTSVVGADDEEAANFRAVRLAPELIGPDNKSYFFLVLPKGITIWGSSATTLGLITAALLVIASVAWLIARGVGRPIGELQRAVSELAAGHTDARVPASIAARRDELGVLAANFNAMANQLDGLIASREQLMREMSHELRSPLTRLQTSIALASERDKLDPAEQERIDMEIRRMNEVIGEMLRYSSLDVRVTIQRRLLRLNKLLERLAEVEELEASGHGCNIQVNAESNLAVVGDRELLRRGFENILRNAIRFAPDGSSVDITARQEGTFIVIEISDRGPGVASEELEHIFEPYMRAAGTGERSTGTGLGLAIVKRVFERHSGEVSARLREGGGLTIQVKIPAAELT